MAWLIDTSIYEQVYLKTCIRFNLRTKAKSWCHCGICKLILSKICTKKKWRIKSAAHIACSKRPQWGRDSATLLIKSSVGQTRSQALEVIAVCEWALSCLTVRQGWYVMKGNTSGHIILSMHASGVVRVGFFEALGTTFF